MQKNIGSKLALYPMPLLVIGTMVDGKPNWLLAGHSGIIGHDRVMVSLVKTHYTNKGIKDTKTLSINTETVANFIHDAVGGDIVKLETEEPYTDNYNDLLDIAQEEQRENARPILSTQIDNIEDYDTIFLGYPIWWGDMPMALYTFLDEYDLSGKTIAPFVTSGGSGLSGTPSDIEDEEPNATVTEGLSIRDDNVESLQSEVNKWLSEIGF